MDIKVNIVELASELANERVFEEFLTGEQGFDYIYKEDSDVVEYTAEAQKVFDDYYDYYYGFIDKYKIN